MDDILKTIAEETRERIRKLKEALPMEALKELACQKRRTDGFLLERALKEPAMTFICECKKASPSKGLISPDFPYLKTALEYEKAGAGAISCLTEPNHFLGKDKYLKEIAEAVRIPVIRKDFTVDPYMIYEAAVLGASAILLIVALLSEEELKEYLHIAEDLGLSCLVETHDEAEIETAKEAGARIIGVNNRNLHDFTVDIHNSIRLRQFIPENILMVAESGIKTRADIEELEEGNINGVLIGETLMRAENKIALLKELKGETV